MMESGEFNRILAKKRDLVGGSAGRSLRRDGLIPAIIYGGDHAPLPVAIEAQSLERARRVSGFATRFLYIDVDGQREKVLPREIQYDPLTDAPLHIDFLRISGRSVISVEVPVRFLGEDRAPGIKRGGILNVVSRSITLLCPADRIPDHLDIDISQFEIGDSAHISCVIPASRISACSCECSCWRFHHCNHHRTDSYDGARQRRGIRELIAFKAHGDFYSWLSVFLLVLVILGLAIEGNAIISVFMALEAITEYHSFSAARQRFSGLMAEGSVNNCSVRALWPWTYMNESGRSVSQAMSWLKLQPADVLVIHDDMDLAPGQVRLKDGGGLAGHRGLASLAACIGSDFRRLRLGIGRPDAGSAIVPWVLGDFTSYEWLWLNPLLAALAEHAWLLLDSQQSRQLFLQAMASRRLCS